MIRTKARFFATELIFVYCPSAIERINDALKYSTKIHKL